MGEGRGEGTPWTMSNMTRIEQATAVTFSLKGPKHERESSYRTVYSVFRPFELCQGFFKTFSEG